TYEGDDDDPDTLILVNENARLPELDSDGNDDDKNATTLTIVFICCELPFFNLLKSNPGYNSPSRGMLSGRLLDNGWTSPNGSNLWKFTIMTPERKEFLYYVSDFSSVSHIGEFLAEVFNKIIECIKQKKSQQLLFEPHAQLPLKAGLYVREDLGSMQKQSTSPHLLHLEFGTHMEKLSRPHNNNKTR
ncbi:13804_t:CDS:2, partial [Entrophospora sp. SA101]